MIPLKNRYEIFQASLPAIHNEIVLNNKRSLSTRAVYKWYTYPSWGGELEEREWLVWVGWHYNDYDGNKK